MNEEVEVGEGFAAYLEKILTIKYEIKSLNGSQKWERKAYLGNTLLRSEGEIYALIVSLLDFVISYGLNFETLEKAVINSLEIIKTGNIRGIEENNHDNSSTQVPKKDVSTALYPKDKEATQKRIKEELDSTENVDMFLSSLTTDRTFLKEIFKMYLESIFEG